MTWREIGTLDADDQDRARATLRRRAGPTPERHPGLELCPHPPVVHVEWVTDPAAPESRRSTVVWCPLCGIDQDDRARAVLAYMRAAPEGAWSAADLALELGLVEPEIRRLLQRLDAGGLLEHVVRASPE